MARSTETAETVCSVPTGNTDAGCGVDDSARVARAVGVLAGMSPA